MTRVAGVLWHGYILAWVVGLPRDFVFWVCVRCLDLCLGFVVYVWFWLGGLIVVRFCISGVWCLEWRLRVFCGFDAVYILWLAMVSGFGFLGVYVCGFGL